MRPIGAADEDVDEELGATEEDIDDGAGDADRELQDRDEGVSTDEDFQSPLNQLPARFAVITDTHIYENDLGIDGTMYSEHQGGDPKMIAASEAVVRAGFNKIIESDVDFIILPGDLSRNGEFVSHVKLAEILKQIESLGIEVFVVPGNHDINTNGAIGYNSEGSYAVQEMNADEFVENYNDFGYSSALYRDNFSLSYIAEPAEGVWLFALDSCVFQQDLGCAGEFLDLTYDWIVEKLSEASSSGKQVIGMMHHNVFDHLEKKSSFMDSYLDGFVIANSDQISQAFVDYGVTVVFTGHYHVHDITVRKIGEKSLYDVVTAAVVSHPSPIRIVDISKDFKLSITTEYVEEIDFDTGDQTFPEYSEAIVDSAMEGFVDNYLQSVPLTSDEKLKVRMLMISAMKQHYQGDENPTEEELAMYEELDSGLTGLATPIISSFWTDLEPKDTTITIDLISGEYFY